MGKISKAESKLHDQAMDLIHSDKPLTIDDKEFCFENYSPIADHNVGKGGIYFTPLPMADTFSQMISPSGDVIDLCAGIGVLTYSLLKFNYYSRESLKRMVCLEINHEFVQIGKRLIPEVEWIEGDVFDINLISQLGAFDCAISNPPYGQIPSKAQATWTKVRGPAQWQVIEVALRMCYNGGGFILPISDGDYEFRRIERKIQGQRIVEFDFLGSRSSCQRAKYLDKHFPDVYVMPVSIEPGEFIGMWKGASPECTIFDVDTNDVEWPRPYGFMDTGLVHVPTVRIPKKEKIVRTHAQEEVANQAALWT